MTLIEKIENYLGEGVDKKLFALGREVNSNLPHEKWFKAFKVTI